MNSGERVIHKIRDVLGVGKGSLMSYIVTLGEGVKRPLSRHVLIFMVHIK